MHLRSISHEGLSQGSGSSQATLRHPEFTTYRCFLPDLTGFAAFRRVGPSSQHRQPGTEASKGGPPGGIQPRYSGLRVRGAANSPPSTTCLNGRIRVGQCQLTGPIRNCSDSRGVPAGPHIGHSCDDPLTMSCRRSSSFPRRRESRYVSNIERCWLQETLDSGLDPE